MSFAVTRGSGGGAARKGVHRWDNRKNGLKGAENTCTVCGTVRRWKNSREVMYLRPDKTGWSEERPECREVQEATRRLVSGPTRGGFATPEDVEEGDLSADG